MPFLNPSDGDFFMTTLNAGQVIPDFVAQATGETPLRLLDYRGKQVLLYFYPKDSTPGCTQEGQDFKQQFAEFTALNCVIFGISRDSLRSHENFKRKQQFPFELISDPDEQLCQLFDVIKMKAMYGKQVRGIERSTFLINADGVLVREWRKVKVKNHVNEVLEQLKQLGSPL
jgi:peroxiredoxin Q/BCP